MDMLVRCPQCQAGNPCEQQLGSNELICRRCGSLLLVWAADCEDNNKSPRPVAVTIKTSHQWNPETENHSHERYALALERRLMEYTYERESMHRPIAPSRHWCPKRVVMASVLILALTAGFAAAKFALHVFKPAEAFAEYVEP